MDLLNKYNLVLKQRNEYLRSISEVNFDNIYLEILNNKLADFGENIYKYRLEYIYKINQYINDIYFNLCSLRGLNILYNSDLKNKNFYLSKLNKSISYDIRYKYTQYGVHRDDYIICIDEKNISNFSSQGQIRLAVLALKLAELKVMKDFYNLSPLLLLDDIFSELDIFNRNKVIKYLNKNIQTIATTTDIKLINEDILLNSKIINLNYYKEGIDKNE